MSESIIQSFYAAIEPQRHLVWSLALSATPTPASAESLLVSTLRAAFSAFAIAPSSPPDLRTLLAAQAPTPPPASPVHDHAMPAAVWSRAWGAVQIDAARLEGSKNRTANFLLADPLLAPKKKDAPAADFSDVVPKSRVLIVAGLLLVALILLIVYLATGHTSPPVPTTWP